MEIVPDCILKSKVSIASISSIIYIEYILEDPFIDVPEDR